MTSVSQSGYKVVKVREAAMSESELCHRAATNLRRRGASRQTKWGTDGQVLEYDGIWPMEHCRILEG